MGGTDYGYKYYSSCKAGSGILFGIYGTKKTSFVELPTPTESVNTYNSQTAILDNETVATIHFVPLEKIKFCQIIRPVYVKYALAFLWTILQECPYMGKNR